jgi:hypothetical protein
MSSFNVVINIASSSFEVLAKKWRTFVKDHKIQTEFFFIFEDSFL